MHCLALCTGAKPRYRYTDPGLLAKPLWCISEQIWDTIQTYEEWTVQCVDLYVQGLLLTVVSFGSE